MFGQRLSFLQAPFELRDALLVPELFSMQRGFQVLTLYCKISSHFVLWISGGKARVSCIEKSERGSHVYVHASVCMHVHIQM